MADVFYEISTPLYVVMAVAIFFSEKVWNFYSSEFEEGQLTGLGGCRLSYIASKSRKASTALVILGGRTEFSHKYAELCYDLRDMDVTIYSLDHRGQGLSQRLLADPFSGYVKNFEDYGADLDLFLKEVVSVHSHRQLFLFGHSMGGTIALDFQLKNPGKIDAMVLSSPMLGVETEPLPLRVAQFLVKTAVVSGLGERVIAGSGYYDSCNEFNGNKVTSSQHRYQVTRDLFQYYEAARLGGPTYNWVDQSFSAMSHIIEEAENITIPILLLQAGSDEVVDNDAQEQFCSGCSSCRLIVIEKAKHELFMEDDVYRDLALRELGDFLLANT